MKGKETEISRVEISSDRESTYPREKERKKESEKEAAVLRKMKGGDSVTMRTVSEENIPARPVESTEVPRSSGHKGDCRGKF